MKPTAELMTALLEAASAHALLVTDRDGVIRLCNPATAALFRRSPDELVGLCAAQLFEARDRARGVPETEMATALARGCARDFRWQVRGDGSRFWAEGTLYPLRDAKGLHFGYARLVRDATAEKAREDEVHRQARVDALTGLLNRAAFHERLAAELSGSQRHRHQFLLHLVDLDHFKAVNDTYGHAVGDQVLVASAERMRQCIRASDVLARLGGDEFALLQPEIDGVQAGAGVATKLLEALATPIDVEGVEIRIGGSIGIAHYPDDGADAEELLHHADLALYKAKSEGRNAFHYFTEAMDARAHWERWEQDQLREAVAAKAFDVLYLPIESADGRIVGVEALLRATPPPLAAVPVEQLVSMAGEMGLGPALGSIVLAAAAPALRRWRAWMPGLRLTLNLSRRQLEDPELPARLADAVRPAGLALDCLDVDIPESQLASDEHAAPLDVLRRHGISAVVDDFGGGHASLLKLARLPVRRVKLDLRHLPGFPADDRSRAIARGILDLAHALGLAVFAEHVETREQADFLRASGCDAMQGSHVAPAMTAVEMEAWLNPRRHDGPPLRVAGAPTAH